MSPNCSYQTLSAQNVVEEHFDNAINRLLQTDYWMKLTEKTRLL